MSEKRKPLSPVVICSAIYVLALLIFSSSTSPLYGSKFLSSDSALFMLFGKGITLGYTPYVDFFDHKGPILFFIEALGVSLGRYGVWLLQCLFGIAGISCFYALWTLLPSATYTDSVSKSFFVPFLSALSVFMTLFDRGNLTEEFSVPFIALSMLLFVKYCVASESEGKHPPLYAFIYGLCFSALAFIRINNAVSICALILVIGVRLLRRREYANFFANFLCGILGILTVALPLCLYFYRRDALMEMINGTFIHNFKYVSSLDNVTPLSFLRSVSGYGLVDLAKEILHSAIVLRYMPLLLSALLWLRNLRRIKGSGASLTPLDYGVLLMLVCNLLNLLISSAFPHYFAISVPVFLFSALCYGDFAATGRKKTITVLVLLCFGVYNLGNLYSISRGYRIYRAERTVVEADLEQIPADERTAVIGFDIPTRFYLYADLFPCYKYCVNQSWFSEANTQVNEDFLAFLKSDKPKWLLTNPDIGNDAVAQIAQDDYSLILEDEYIRIYRLAE